MIADSDADRKQVAKNLHRRHLDESQRAMVAGKLANLRDGQRADRAASIDAPSLTQSQAADLLNVSRPSVQRAHSIKIDALTRLGEMIKAAKDSERIREGRPKKNGSDVEPFPERETLADLGIDKKVRP